MTEYLRTGGLPIGLPDDIPTLKRMIDSEERFATDKTNLNIMKNKLKRIVEK